MTEIDILHKEAYDLIMKDKITTDKDWNTARVLYQKILLMDSLDEVAFNNLSLIQVIT